MAQDLALGIITGMHPTPAAALQVVSDLQLPTVQIGYQRDLDNEAGIASIKAALAATGIEITAIFCSFAGESYADIPTVARTVGLVPEASRAERIAVTDDISKFAAALGVDRVAAHIGCIPEDASDPQYPVLVKVVRDICAKLAARGQVFALETGQETAAGLRQFITDLKVDNIRVNFDPANMILYGNDDPIAAVPVLAEWIDGVHCKDGCWPTEKGQLGQEKPFGEGDVDAPRWIETLLATGFRGPLTIEREISGEEQRRDIARARDLILDLLARGQ
jgi:sugar phosphate isomerase/epimerase